MISRKQIADAYQCCVDYARMKIRAAGIEHQKHLSLEEFRKVISVNGWPINGQYDDLAQRAMKIPKQMDLFQNTQQHG